MMLQIDHRESRDVDFFLRDPQLLPFLDPQKQDFKFEISPSDYSGDGTRFLRFSFRESWTLLDITAGHPYISDAKPPPSSELSP